MELLKDRRVVFILMGGAVALAAGILIAMALMSGGRGANTPPPASRGGLVVESTSAADDGKPDGAKPLRCFVAGQFVGELTLADCAKKNGVATDALDVGIDENGALAAADQAGTNLAPLPPAAEPAPVTPLEPAASSGAASGPAGGCWRYAGDWRRLPGDLTLNACVQALFAGRCEKPGQASYGRWMQQTLRLVPGRVEVSSDNHTFRTLVEQGPGCSTPLVG
ncbi:hypothetical protein [Phenylobacterium sp.]|uniref:hypothetical protein n=1 Tax=Phenylobacterium sp. TaxID=1871053 RepID=UPI0035B35A2C